MRRRRLALPLLLLGSSCQTADWAMRQDLDFWWACAEGVAAVVADVVSLLGLDAAGLWPM